MTETRYTCGHVGHIAKGRTVETFIRVAEVRNNPVEENDDEKCPDCK